MTNRVKWTIDPTHSEIAFKVRHLMIAHVRGAFKLFGATIHTINNDFTKAEIELWIDPSSIATGDEKRDEHLKSADFFSVEKYRQITFESSAIGQSKPDGNHELWGELTMRDISKKIKLEVQFGGTLKDPWGVERSGFTVRGKINRSDWGLLWNTKLETGGLMVSDEVSILCEVELMRVEENEIAAELHSDTSQKVGL